MGAESVMARKERQRGSSCDCMNVSLLVTLCSEVGSSVRKLDWCSAAASPHRPKVKTSLILWEGAVYMSEWLFPHLLTLSGKTPQIGWDVYFLGGSKSSHVDSGHLELSHRVTRKCSGTGRNVHYLDCKGDFTVGYGSELSWLLQIESL